MANELNFWHQRQEFCDGDCNNCEATENRQLTVVLNALHEVFGDDVYHIVQHYCPNMTCCADCRIDDFCHDDSCELLEDARRCATALLAGARPADRMKIEVIMKYAMRMREVLERMFLFWKKHGNAYSIQVFPRRDDKDAVAAELKQVMAQAEAALAKSFPAGFLADDGVSLEIAEQYMREGQELMRREDYLSRELEGVTARLKNFPRSAEEFARRKAEEERRTEPAQQNQEGEKGEEEA